MYRVTTGLFGFFLLMVYGRLGKLNKLFKRDYPCCIPFCNLKDRLCFCFQEYESETESSRKSTNMSHPSKTDAEAGQKVAMDNTPDPPALDAITSAGSEASPHGHGHHHQSNAGGLTLDAPLSPLAAGRTDLGITPREHPEEHQPKSRSPTPKLAFSESKARVLGEVIEHRNLMMPDQEILVTLPEEE